MRYRGRVHAYEIWNEPNHPDFFSGRPETMLELARQAYQILKQVDGSVIVVSPSATGDEIRPSGAMRALPGGAFSRSSAKMSTLSTPLPSTPCLRKLASFSACS